MTNKRNLCWHFLFLFLFKTSTADDTLGPADVIIESAEVCENDESFELPYSIVYRKFNRTHAGFTGCYTLPTDLDMTYTLNLTAAKWGDGGWKPNAFDYVGADVCDTLSKNTPDQFLTVTEHVGVPPSCPVPKGEYCIKDLVVPLENLMPSMIYGRFRVDLIIERDEKPFACGRVYAQSSRPKDASKMIKT